MYNYNAASGFSKSVWARAPKKKPDWNRYGSKYMKAPVTKTVKRKRYLKRHVMDWISTTSPQRQDYYKLRWKLAAGNREKKAKIWSLIKKGQVRSAAKRAARAALRKKTPGAPRKSMAREARRKAAAVPIDPTVLFPGLYSDGDGPPDEDVAATAGGIKRANDELPYGRKSRREM